MGSFVPSNFSICGILNFAGRGKCSTPVVNGDSVCCTKASMETGARPYRYLHVVDFLLDVLEPLLPRPLLVAILSEGLVRIMLPGAASFPSRQGLRCCSSWITGFWSFRACRVS